MQDNLSEMFSKEVSLQEEGIRLDKFLSGQFPDISRSRLQKLISDGKVFLKSVIIDDNSYKTKNGDVYKIIIPAAEDADPEPENIELNIIYEDNDILVINKPAGMTVHPAAGAYHGTLVNALLYHCKNSLSGIGGIKRPGIVHRIDKDTSGLLVVAKNDVSHNFLSEQFAKHSIERTYLAFVYGTPNPLKGRIEGNIGRSFSDRKKMALVQTGGKQAVTNYQTIELFKRAAAFVKCNLETGRTHQIRVHLSSIGNALIGDQVYVKNHKSSLSIPTEIKVKINSFPRQALHAKSLGFIHPRTKEFMQFDSELPRDLAELYNMLKMI